MTKIFAYSIREDEHSDIKKWATAHTEVEVDYTDQPLTAETAALAGGADGIVSLQTSQYTREALQALAAQGTKNISVRNVGIENIDFDAAAEFGFRVSNVPIYSPNSIAEHAIIQLTRLFRELKPMDEKVVRQDFRWSPTIGREVRMQTIGVVGTGHIGSISVQIARGFGAKVIAYDINRNPELEVTGLYVDTLDELLEQADGITLHIPGGPATYHLFDEAAFAKMKDHVVISNAARGTIIDTKALLAALDSGKVSGAALDVYENEVGYFDDDWQNKELDDKVLADLLTRDNVLVSPHTAFYTTKAIEEMIQKSFDASLALSTGKETPLEIKFLATVK